MEDIRGGNALAADTSDERGGDGAAAAIRQLARDFARRELYPLEQRLEEEDGLPEEVWQDLRAKAREIGLWGLTANKKYGGAGLDSLTAGGVLEELGKLPPAFAIIPPGVLGGSAGRMEEATPEQQEKYFMPTMRGEKTSAFGLTEPGGGSDVANIKTSARREGDHYLLNGEKHFISNGDKADFFIIFAKSGGEGSRHQGFTSFIVERGTPGFTVGPRQKMMGIRGAVQTQIFFDNAVVPAVNVLGKEGDAFYRAMESVTGGRLSFGASFTGQAVRAFEEAVSYARQRVTFGEPLLNRQALQFQFADLAVEIAASRGIWQTAARTHDAGQDARILASMAKLYASELAGRAADFLVQIYGGAGLMKGTIPERIYRDVRAFRIFEGASEIQRTIISRAIVQGMSLG